MTANTNILFTATFSTPFIRADASLLRSHFRVTEISSSGILTLFRYVIALRKNDLTFSWFASVYSSFLILFCKLIGKKSILILGGVDVARIPEFHYGIWNSRWKSVIVRYGITHADIVLAVDPSIKEDAMMLTKADGHNISILPTGHNHRYWTPSKAVKKKSILTVASCNDYTRFRIKGIDFLFDVARLMPEEQFVLIGYSNALRAQFHPPHNVSTIEFIPQESLLEHYQQTKVYFQPSLREALGSTLCEAMLCGCYPVGTNVGGIPNVIGTTGSVIPFGDTATAVKAIREGLTAPLSDTARERIIGDFSPELRESTLVKLITSLNDK